MLHLAASVSNRRSNRIEGRETNRRCLFQCPYPLFFSIASICGNTQEKGTGLKPSTDNNGDELETGTSSSPEAEERAKGKGHGVSLKREPLDLYYSAARQDHAVVRAAS